MRGPISKGVSFNGLRTLRYSGRLTSRWIQYVGQASLILPLKRFTTGPNQYVTQLFNSVGPSCAPRAGNGASDYRREHNKKAEALWPRKTCGGLTNVLFKRYQPKAQLKFSLTLPDVHLVSLKPALEGLIVPSKFYSSIAAGRAVIFIGDADGEIARDVARGECGVTVSADDALALAKTIERLCDDAAACARMGANARAMFEAEYSQAIAMGKWRGVLAEVQEK